MDEDAGDAPEFDEFDVFDDDNKETNDNAISENPHFALKFEEFVSNENVNFGDVPRIKYQVLNSGEGCLHEVAVPPNVDFHPLEPMPSVPAKTYDFILDSFQEKSILCVENNQSVLVSAHTSAGKTVVAEYCIAKCLKLKQRVIYTTPIKALSNQKYREFKEEYGDIGLMTGDVTISPNAGCVIMTTEILRNMLYRGSELMREVSWVIFDEIHYMRDKERGYVWEETLILLPDNVHYIFLSATIPNARQFAEWICYVHEQPCHVVYTEYRPVPLHHFIYPMGGDGIYLVVDDKGQFSEKNFDKALKIFEDNKPSVDAFDRPNKRKDLGSKTTNCNKIIALIMERNLAPAIIFSFSKKECELYAKQISNLDFNSKSEKKLVTEVFNNAIDVLSDDDKALPQIQCALPMLLKGIGIHHGGLLPVLKEATEILFGEGLIKALFATETFAMGLNMPARTVMFTAIKKFDGKDTRFLNSGEFVQMSGRAGRRGLDDRGTVITVIDQQVTPSVAKDLFLGKVSPLNSAYQLTYNMILNLLRVDGINPEFMMERSFHQFQTHSKIPEFEKKISGLRQQLKDLKQLDGPVLEYFMLQKQLEELDTKRRSMSVNDPKIISPFLKYGRLVKVFTSDRSDTYDWGAVVTVKSYNDKEANPVQTDSDVLVDVLLQVKLDASNKPCPCSVEEEGEIQILTVSVNTICEASVARIFMHEDLKPLNHKKAVIKAIKEVHKRFNTSIPLLDPIEHMKIKEPAFLDTMDKIKHIEEKLKNNPARELPDLEDHLEIFIKRNTLLNEMEVLKNNMKESMSLIQMVELKDRKRVLQKLGYCSEGEVILLKGRVACEISSCDELLLTEVLFANLLKDLSPQAVVALLSCFICDEKVASPRFSEELQKPLSDIKQIAKNLVKVYNSCHIDVTEENYLNQLKPYFVELTFQWAQGASFREVCSMADMFEGSFIRCLKRMEELLRQLVQAAKGIGNDEMELKFQTCIQLIKRGIAFAASLYL